MSLYSSFYYQKLICNLLICFFFTVFLINFKQRKDLCYNLNRLFKELRIVPSSFLISNNHAMFKLISFIFVIAS